MPCLHLAFLLFIYFLQTYSQCLWNVQLSVNVVRVCCYSTALSKEWECKYVHVGESFCVCVGVCVCGCVCVGVWGVCVVWARTVDRHLKGTPKRDPNEGRVYWEKPVHQALLPSLSLSLFLSLSLTLSSSLSLSLFCVSLSLLHYT